MSEITGYIEMPFHGGNGESAYEIAVKHGYKGTEAQWVESLGFIPDKSIGKEKIKDELISEIEELTEKNAQMEKEIISLNPLKGKKACFFGDSICYGNGYEGGYGKIIGEKNDMIVQNMGVGSTYISDDVAASTIITAVGGVRTVWTTLKNGAFDPSLVDFSLTDDFGSISYMTRVWNGAHHQYDYVKMEEKDWDKKSQLFILRPSISGRVDFIDKDCDYIIGEGGYNDLIGGLWIGEMGEDYTCEIDSHSVIGGTEKLCRKLLSKFPGKKLGFILMHKALTYPLKAAPNADGTQGFYFEEMKKVFKKYSIPVLDLYNTSGLNTGISEFLKYTRSNDGVHPTEEGYRLFYAPKIEEWMKIL